LKSFINLFFNRIYIALMYT